MEDAITLTLLGLYGGLILLDLFAPARAFPTIPGWRARGLAFFVLNVGLSIAGPLFWDAWLAPHRLFDLTGLGHAGGFVVGLLVLELGIYAWHRSLHTQPQLFRRLHQMHHSAERIDIFGAFYFHPVDFLAFTFVGSLALVLGVGITAEAAILVNAVVTFLAYFQHANVKTPHWLGYLIQRPEQHMVHHERGLHAFNYCDLPFIDMLFGTFRNPKEWSGVGGYYDGASARVGAMLVGQDVTAPPAADTHREDPVLSDSPQAA